jgi:AraC-like DNA-binding protein
VLGYCEVDLQIDKPVVRRLLPQPIVTVLIDLVPPIRRMVTRPGAPVSSIKFPVSGPRDRPLVFEQSGRHTSVMIAVTPIGAHKLFDIPMRELTNTSIEFTDLLGTRGSLLIEQLAETTTWSDRVTILDKAVMDRLTAAQPATGLIDHAWKQLCRSAGTIPISQLAERLGVSVRYLEIQFGTQIGLTPKSSAKILRFQRALTVAALNPGSSWSTIAHMCGYGDQAHLTRDVKQLSGLTPTRLLNPPITRTPNSREGRDSG